eukprot:CAMPEP_0201739152 /NCGR_PEP_ID=MMETSP0593-20130828/45630_1 /ASSEMBLY_ACC=CAM_ASM_000672 /TAXON_ID=267983 /ORGANISM="Skeletonema japonicum, Strain CCMP2506" /LENGTH=486 /DNA_ID=CAMNT_0048233405 /DNA_START=117 /DNA_END=1577 /DNA_ORIENTATION=+
MTDEDNSTPADSPKAQAEAADAAAVDETAAAISSITVEDASDDEAIPSPPPQQQQDDEDVPAAAAHQFNFNLPAAAPPLALAAVDPNNNNNMDFGNLDPSEINAQFLSLLPSCIHPRLDKLKSLSEDRLQLLEQYLIERAALEQKYCGLMKPLYEERRSVILGECDEQIRATTAATTSSSNNHNNDTNNNVKGIPQFWACAMGHILGECDEQIRATTAATTSSSNNHNNDTNNNVKGIPQFWACAMGHIDLLAELITEQDVDCLDHLTDITCNDFADGSGFELHFHFNNDTNDFFTNSVLTKRYEVPNLLTEDEPMLQSVTGTEIDWKHPNKCLTHKTITKKQRKKGGPNAGQVRTIQKTERAESFFHFFTPPKMPELGDVVDEEEADAMEEHFDHDYEMACVIRGSLIPNAVHWFTGEAMEEDDMYGDEEGMMMFEEGEDEDGEGGDGSGGFVFHPNGGSGGSDGSSPFPPPAAGEGENPECKQN